jgi:hypothetical protein
VSLAIVLYTAEGPQARRTRYAVETMTYLRRNVCTPEPVWIHVADDGSSPAHLAAITAAAEAVPPAEAGHTIGHWTTSQSAGRGYGPNVNAARACLAHEGPPEFLLCIEDDWRLVRRFDAALAAMQTMMRTPAFSDVGMVRLSYIAYTAKLYGLFRWDGTHQWLELRRDSEEGFIFSGNPRLEHWHFQKDFQWADGAQALDSGPPGRGWPGDYELDVAWRLKQRPHGHRTEVVWPVDFLPAAASAQSYFQHFGADRSFA